MEDVDGEDRNVGERHPHPCARHRRRECPREQARDRPIRERTRSRGNATGGACRQVLIRLMLGESAAPTCRPSHP